MTAKSKSAKPVAARKSIPSKWSRDAIRQHAIQADAGTPPYSVIAVRAGSKSAMLLALLRAKHGASIAEMMKATGWQAHSVRGFLAGAARKRHGMAVTSERPEGEERRYRGG